MALSTKSHSAYIGILRACKHLLSELFLFVSLHSPITQASTIQLRVPPGRSRREMSKAGADHNMQLEIHLPTQLDTIV